MDFQIIWQYAISGLKLWGSDYPLSKLGDSKIENPIK